MQKIKYFMIKCCRTTKSPNVVGLQLPKGPAGIISARDSDSCCSAASGEPSVGTTVLHKERWGERLRETAIKVMR